MAGRTFTVLVQEWRLLIEHARPLLADAPHLAEHHAALEAVVQQGEAFQALDEMARAQRRSATHRRREMTAEGVDLRARLAGGLVQKYGPKNEELIAFGVGPRPRKVSRGKKETPEPAPVPPVPPAPATPPG